MLPEPNYIQIISDELQISEIQVINTKKLLDEGATVPFIARYRREYTHGLDEDQIRLIIQIETRVKNLYEAKLQALEGISELGQLTLELEQNIINAKTLKEVEDIYKPYKSKKKTKAMIALENGFGVISEMIKQNTSFTIPDDLLKDFTHDEVIEGALEIIAVEISENTTLREVLITNYKKYGNLVSSKKSDKMLEKLNEKDTKEIPKFEIYFDNILSISRIKSYQILAINRGEKLGILTVKIDKDEIIFDKFVSKYLYLLEIRQPLILELEQAIDMGYKKLFSSVENEIRADLKEISEDESIEIFQTNLEKLLMSKPTYGKTILAIDPGYRAGCKLAVLDDLRNPIYLDKIYLHQESRAKSTLKDIIKKYKIDQIVIGNGTASDESVELSRSVFDGDIYIVNESGASVYSASKIAGEEFPDIEAIDRGTISIGRRYIDPLAELVKVPVGSIGVGMYQHDIASKKLDEQLGYVVEDSVNEVGININTASIYLLNHISGIDKRQAKKIYNNRPYSSRADLKKVLSDATYTQAIGFLRVPDSQEELDNTDIHPEQYDLAHYLIDNNQKTLDDKSKELYEGATKETIDFIWTSYNNLGLEKRTTITHTKARDKVSIDSIKQGSVLEGVVRNVVPFGAFVDIGLDNDGLVHISQLSDGFVKDPNDIVSVGDRVKVRVLEMDKDSGKMSLSMRG